MDTDSDDDGIMDQFEDNNNDGDIDDTDYNGAFDYGETKPDSNNTDRDSLLDGEEDDGDGVVEDGETDPRIEDTDGDGLWEGTNSTEYGYIGEQSVGTNPVNRDTDGDGLSDGQEIEGWSIQIVWANTREPEGELYKVAPDPLLVDTDFDGVTDFNESKNGSDPRKADTDGDFILDKHESSGNFTVIEGDPPIGPADGKPLVQGFLTVTEEDWYGITYYTVYVTIFVVAKDNAGLHLAAISIDGIGSIFAPFNQSSIEYGGYTIAFHTFMADWGHTLWSGYDIKVNVTDINGNWAKGEGYIKSVKDHISELLGPLWSALSKVVHLLTVLFDWIWNAIKSLFDAVLKPIIDYINNWVTGIFNALDVLFNYINNHPEQISKGLQALMIAFISAQALFWSITCILVAIECGYYISMAFGIMALVQTFIISIISMALTGVMNEVFGDLVDSIYDYFVEKIGQWTWLGASTVLAITELIILFFKLTGISIGSGYHYKYLPRFNKKLIPIVKIPKVTQSLAYTILSFILIGLNAAAIYFNHEVFSLVFSLLSTVLAFYGLNKALTTNNVVFSKFCKIISGIGVGINLASLTASIVTVAKKS